MATTPANPFLNQAQQLFDIYTTNYDPGQQGLEFWANKFAAPGADAELIRREFLNPAQGSAAPRFSAMQADPDYLAAIGKGPNQAQELFNTYTTGFDPGQKGLDYWNQQINTLGYQNALSNFLQPEDPNAPRMQAMKADPDYAKGLASLRDTELFRQATGQVGESNRLELDQELRNWYNTYTGGKGMANSIDDYISMLSGRDSTNLNQDYAAAKQRMLRDAQQAGLYGGDIGASTAYDLWAMKQTPENQARELFKTYATGMTPDANAIKFWSEKFADPNETRQSVIEQFLNPENRQAARISTLEKDPQYLAAKGLLSLPGSKTTVANPEVADALAKSAEPGKEQKTVTEIVDPANISEESKDKARALFDRYATGFETDDAAINFWASRFEKEGATDASVLNDFLNPKKGANAPRTFLMQADPDYVAAQKAARGVVDTSGFPKFEGTPYDPKAYDTLVKQLTAQQQVLEKQAGFKYGSTFGGAQETIADMAKRLAAAGISDIRDFGQRYAMVAEKVYETIPGDEGGSMTFDTGKYRTITGIEGYDGDNNPIYKYRELSPSEVKRLKFDDEGMAFLDAKKDDIAENPFAESVYYNKKTGEIIDKRKFGGKAESGIWGSSGAGDGYTNYRVQYTKDGTPIFYPEKNLSGMKEFIAEDLSGILSVLRFIPGAQIPVMIAQAAAAAHMGADPKDILKQVGTTLLASNLGNIAPGVMDKLGIDMPTTDIGKMAYSGGLGALQSLIQGGDIESALKSGLLSAGSTGIRGLLPTPVEGEMDYSKILTALAPALADGKLSNADVFRLIQAAIPGDKKKTPGKP